MSRGTHDRDDDYDDRYEDRYDDRDDDYDDRGAWQKPHRATLILVLGILSIAVCAPLGIAAWMMGKNDLAEMKAGRMDRSGKDMTYAGYIVGIVGTVLFGIQLCFVCLYVAIIGAVIGAGK